MTQRKPIVAFVCTHNSCRSIMAEAVARQVAGDRLTVVSAGTNPIDAPNPVALATLHTHGYSVEGLTPKNLQDIPTPDWLITMGCGVACPLMSCSHVEDWGLADPTDRGAFVMEQCLRAIERKVADLCKRIG